MTLGFDKFISKVSTHRRQSEPSILEIAATNSQNKSRRLSMDNGHCYVRESTNNHHHLNTVVDNLRQRAGSFSFISHHHNHHQNSHDNYTVDPLTSNGARISRSRSRSKSVGHGEAISPAYFSKNKTKDLVKQETAHIILKKLLNMLQDLDLQNPIALKTISQGSESKFCKIYVSNTNNCIYLPAASSTSFTYEDDENGGVIIAEDRNDEMPTAVNNNTLSMDSINHSETDFLDSPPPPDLFSKMKSFHSPNYLTSKIDSECPIPHTFAVIVELTKDSLIIKDLHFQFQSLTTILWPTGDAYNRTHAKEKFTIGNMEWRTSLSDADYYINSSNSNDVKLKNLGPEDLINRTREYKLIDIEEPNNSSNSLLDDDMDINNITSPLSTSPTSSSTSTNSTSNSLGSDSYKAGLYVFLLPILLPEHIPASIVSINGSLAHTLLVECNKYTDKLNRKSKVSASYNLPMVRTPPNIGNSIADKPIYVNRIWNDTVHYIITFPRKYVTLGCEHMINVKLLPMVKDVVIKRIKFNVLERITYVSKNLSREYDYDSEDPYCIHPVSKENKVRERVVSLYELKTKAKQSSGGHLEAYKQEVMKCPENNLLFSCYEVENDNNNGNSNGNGNKNVKQKNKDQPMIATPLDINVSLPFLTTMSDSLIMTSAIEEEGSDLPHTSRRGSAVSMTDNNTTPSINNNPLFPFLGAVETNGASINEIGDHTLFPDSNFRHIEIKHRLQVTFRISKPDLDNKMHHYEVVIDTPIVLLSSKCQEDSPPPYSSV